ncbi:MAG: hypothetical protein HN336_02385 [Lentimicrobiaceae bacterium]|jgi:hypothetical protein|nr:hypothetical protein [Lentimicrobiaceae bacterium]MCP4910449.1 hypothetical protein [Bacteroidota bacterium]MBT3454303.1 hypothetical protein [Lentimicrobiaceae bacterium]MBT3817973.1 hypothetical protein [Lentimicrobiaceae bacterium]MBT4061521.1 hypothetical protein [Lentimicrobiaceae bacterium]
MAFKWRKWNRAVHRDFGYLFSGMVLIYAISGIAINHVNDWNPNFVVLTEEFSISPPPSKPSKAELIEIIKIIGEEEGYKSHYFPEDDFVKIFIKDGTVFINLENGNGLVEKTKRRPIFREVNYLHYNPIKYWTWFSDIFAGALILLSLTGIFIPRGDNGISVRGAWMVTLGILIPIIYLVVYFY